MRRAGNNEGDSGNAVAIDRCLRIWQVCELTGISRATVYRKVNDGNFPKPFHLSPMITVWRVSAIENWIREREQH